jgi:hypothetical protein
MNDFPAVGQPNGYAGTTSGYNILPNYGVNNNNSGFNGITMRWLGVASAPGKGVRIEVRLPQGGRN